MASRNELDVRWFRLWAERLQAASGRCRSEAQRGGARFAHREGSGAHGAAVGIGTALVDLALGKLLGGPGAISLVFAVSNVGRILAGVLGGWFGSPRVDVPPAT